MTHTVPQELSQAALSNSSKAPAWKVVNAQFLLMTGRTAVLSPYCHRPLNASLAHRNGVN